MAFARARKARETNSSLLSANETALRNSARESSPRFALTPRLNQTVKRNRNVGGGQVGQFRRTQVGIDHINVPRFEIEGQRFGSSTFTRRTVLILPVFP